MTLMRAAMLAIMLHIFSDAYDTLMIQNLINYISNINDNNHIICINKK